jgi:lipopolysaccharide transport system permease protein
MSSLNTSYTLHWGALWDRRFALINLVLKDFRVRYRNMSLGMAWSVLNPLVMLGVLMFVFTYIYPRPQRYFPIFLLLGLIAYNFFALCMASATACIVDNSPLVKKVAFPRLFIPISTVLAQMIHVAIQLLLLACFIVVFRVPITAKFLWLPALYLIELVFILGAALIACTLYVYFRDTKYVVDSLVTIGFWLTPVFYSLQNMHERLPRLGYAMYVMNPLAGCIEAARRVVVYGVQPDYLSLAIAAAVAVVTLATGLILFGRGQRFFADRV